MELLQLLDAVSRMASLGFEKSYREAVVLMTRSYMSKLADVGSAESKTQAPEATTERIEVYFNVASESLVAYSVRRLISNKWMLTCSITCRHYLQDLC